MSALATTDSSDTKGKLKPSNSRGAQNSRWLLLAVVSTAQLIAVLDNSIVNIALPQAQRSLGMSDGERQWVVTAYAVTFAGLLLLSGRLNDRLGQKTCFMIGLAGFAAASAIGGAAANPDMLITARACQGIFAALLSPAVISLVSLTFPGGRDRAKAFGILSSVAAGGGAIGLLLGGVLTEWISWRWTLYVNVAFALPALIAAIKVIPHVRSRAVVRIDMRSAAVVTAGLASLVYGFTSAEDRGWTNMTTILFFLVGLILISAFVAMQLRSKEPLLPLSVVMDRNRGGAYLAAGIVTMANFGQFLLMTFYLQIVLGYTPIQSGLAFLPLTGSIVVGAMFIGARLSQHFAARVLMASAYIVASAGFFGYALLTPSSSYWNILPSAILVGLGIGVGTVPATSMGTYNVSEGNSGTASAMVSTSQQVGGRNWHSSFVQCG